MLLEKPSAVYSHWKTGLQTNINGDELYSDDDDDDDDEDIHLWADATQLAYTGNHFLHGAPAQIIYHWLQLDKQI